MYVYLVYDILSGKIEQKLEGHRACVRDVSWHPFNNVLVSSSVSLSLHLSLSLSLHLSLCLMLTIHNVLHKNLPLCCQL